MEDASGKSYLLGDENIMEEIKIKPKLKAEGIKNSRQILNKQEFFLKLLNSKTKKRKAKIERVDRSKVLPLSWAQQRLWFVSQLDQKASGAYHVPIALGLKGDLDKNALNRAFITLLNRHEILRTNICLDKQGQPFQFVHNLGASKIELYNLSEYISASDKTYKSLVREIVSVPFDLAMDSLIRVALIEIEDKVHSLIVVLHHIVTDGWSIKILTSELAILYSAYREGKSNPLSDLPIQYADYAVWQRGWLQGEVLDKESAYWREQLQGVQTIEIPTDRPRPPTPSYKGAWSELKIDAELTQSLRALGRQYGCSMYMTLLAVLKLLMHRYTQQEDICVGSPTANRLNAEIEPVMGFFVNTLAMRARVDGCQSFVKLLKQVKSVALSSYDHQVMPFEQVVEVVDPGRSQAFSPLFQVMFILQNPEEEMLQMSGLTVEWERIVDCEISKLDFTLELQETRHRALVGGIEYSTDLYDETTIERLKHHYLGLIRSVIVSPQAPMYELEFLTESEKRQMLIDWNDTEVSYSSGGLCINELFEVQVKRTPDRVAVIFEDRELTYTELDAFANQLAHFLIDHGVKRDDLVGIALKPSLDMVVSMLAILKADAGYLPLDAGLPQARVVHMCSEANLCVILTQLGLLEGGLVANYQSICLDDCKSLDEISKYPMHAPGSRC